MAFAVAQASCMLLINALIGNADGLDFKIHLRSDFARCGLAQAIDHNKQLYGYENESRNDNDPLLKQIEIFENQAHANFEELDSNLENIESVFDGE